MGQRAILIFFIFIDFEIYVVLISGMKFRQKKERVISCGGEKILRL